jgi:general secretion pathway protein D
MFQKIMPIRNMKIYFAVLIVLYLITSSFSLVNAQGVNEPVFNYKNALDLDALQQLNGSDAVVVNNNTKNCKLYKIYLKYGDPKQVKNSLLDLFPKLNVTIDDRTRSLLFYTDKSSFHKASIIAKRLDKKLSQVKIEVKIIEVNYEGLDQYENIFSEITSGFKINYDYNNNKINPMSALNSQLVALTKKGNAKILAKPTITTIDNNKALIKIGDKVPYITTVLNEYSQSNQVHHLDTGIELQINPKIIDQEQILVSIIADISVVKMWKDLGSTQYPLLSNRKAETKVYINNKETLVIAGLFDEQKKKNETSIPFLSDIPIIGDLFKDVIVNHNKTDILFLITPEII